jgi:hypothetical protein
MIVVTIELWPGGYKEKSRPLGVISITNDGTGTKEKSNYNYVLSHAGMFFGKRKEPFKKGSVRGFFRNLSPYRLLARCLKDAGEV